MIKPDDFKKMEFTSFGFVEEKRESIAYRLPANFKPNNVGSNELRGMVSNLVNDKKKEFGYKNIEDLMEELCNIPISTYKKYMGGKNRIPTRPFMAKLCIGLKLSIDEANAFFRAQGGELNLTNDVDAIIYYALETRDTVEEYEKELAEKTGIK